MSFTVVFSVISPNISVITNRGHSNIFYNNISSSKTINGFSHPVFTMPDPVFNPILVVSAKFLGIFLTQMQIHTRHRERNEFIHCLYILGGFGFYGSTTSVSKEMWIKQ